MATINTPTPLPQQKKRSLSELISGPIFWFLVVALIGASAVVFYFVFWTTWRDTKAGQGDLSTMGVESDIRDAEQRLLGLQQHDKQLNELAQSDLDRMAIALPTGPAYPELLVQLEALARETGMLNASFLASVSGESSAKGKPAAQAASSGPTPLTITGAFDFNVHSYESLKTIVEALQKNLRLLDVVRLSYDPLTQKVNIGFVTYYIE